MRLKGNAFVKNSLTLSGGVAVAQVLQFLFYPLLGRLFQASQFGMLATVTAITSVLAVIGSGRYESAILIARSKDEAARLALLSLLLGWLFYRLVGGLYILSWRTRCVGGLMSRDLPVGCLSARYALMCK